MPRYAIGDLQGCCDAFECLLEQIRFDPAADRLWLVGDLVNRGPESLRTLRLVKSLGDAAVCVLGNHDFHLLAVALGVRRLHRSDTLAEILEAPDATELLDWLRHRRLAYREDGWLMVHAGVLPQWDAATVMTLAGEVEAALRGSDWKIFFAHLFGNQPDRWDDALTGWDRLRVIVNALARLRFCTAEGVMEFDAKEGIATAPPGYLPWFDVPQRATRDVAIACGHWSTLGLIVRPDLIALDTGCVWGGPLTAVRLEDRVSFQVPCPQNRRLG